MGVGVRISLWSFLLLCSKHGHLSSRDASLAVSNDFAADVEVAWGGNRLHPDQNGFESHRRQFEWKNVGVVFPSAGVSPGRVWQSLFRHWFLKRQHERRLAQMAEHQILYLGVAGSIPVPNTKLSAGNRNPSKAQLRFHISSLKKADVGLICQTEPVPNLSHAARKRCGSVWFELPALSARRDAMQDVDTAFRWQQKKESKAARCTVANSEKTSQQQPCCRRAPTLLPADA